MKKVAGSIGALLMSALLLTSCSDGSQDSPYYSMTKEQVKSAGLKAKVSVGKLTSQDHFVTLEFNDHLTREQLLKSVEILSSVDVPEETERRVEWDMGKYKGNSSILFNTSTPDMEEVEKLAKVLDITEGELNNVYLNLNSDGEPPEVKPRIVFNVDERLTDQENQKTTDEINAINNE